MIPEISKSRVFDLGRPLEAGTPTSPNHPPFRMALIRRHGDRVRADGSSGANELFTMGGHTGTHIDALCHVSLNGELFGGLSAADASVGGRFKHLGVETIEPILCRGIVLDVARALGQLQLPAGYAISGQDLQTTIERSELTVHPGDAVLIRTGWPVDRYDNQTAYLGEESGVPGPDVSAGEWLAEHHVRLTGSDTIAYEHLPPGAGHAHLPVHNLLLVDYGIHIVEVLDLEELALARPTEFLFVLIPLKLVGATGSPVRPLALA